ncbi:MAG: hypothetical protein KBI41_00170 [Kiritimatiellae bacterium]|nr:hypothetical protein [Kiritimatiellia bacterium]
MKMNQVLSMLAVCGLVCGAEAQVRRSSRNPQPLTRRPEATAEQRAQRGSSQVGVSTIPQKREQPVTTITRVTFLGPKSGWGIVKATSPYYAPNGKRLGTLPGGTVFTYNDVKSSSRNDVLVCMVRRDTEQEGPYLIDCTDAAGYEGDPATLDPELIQNLSHYFTVNGRLKDRQTMLERDAKAKNPHAESVKQTSQEYQASIKKATEMEREMNNLTGARRSKALDTLRSLKYEQAAIKKRADQAAATAKEWEAKNKLDPAVIDADPEIRALRAELEEARKPVANLIPAQ